MDQKSPKYGVTIQKENALLKKFERLHIKETDIQEKFIRAGGRGGQKVNKTSSCVYLKHIPSGIEVKCQKSRHQSLNRFLARRTLATKIENMILGKKSKEQQRIEKIRRQKRKRSKRAKEKILRLKKIQGEKKKLRKPPQPENGI